MTPNATALANYFVDKAEKENFRLMQLGLMKRVYITHGFCLAIFEISALDPRFDTVEAWKNGPVIPSVYHSFKYNKNNPIKDKSVITDEMDKDGIISFVTPELEENRRIMVADMVWERYKEYSDYELVELTHKEGTPWALSYTEGKNNPIDDSLTKAYYDKLIVR